jgi:hypothetical protein
VPWARERSGFTLLFEALVMALVKEMPVAAVADLVGESDMRIWRVLHHYVDAAVDGQDLSRLERLGIDETMLEAVAADVVVAAPPRFVDLDDPLQRIATGADHRPPELVQPCPRGLVATQAEDPLQPERGHRPASG